MRSDTLGLIPEPYTCKIDRHLGTNFELQGALERESDGSRRIGFSKMEVVSEHRITCGFLESEPTPERMLLVRTNV